MEVARDEPIGADHGDAGITQGRHQRPDDVTGRQPPRVEHDDDRAGGTSEAGLQRVAGAERLHRRHELVVRPADRDRTGRHDQHLQAIGSVGLQRIQRGPDPRDRIRDDDHAGLGGRVFLEPGGHRCDCAVPCLPTVEQVRRQGWSKRECGAVIDHQPTGCLDTGLERVRARPIALEACERSLLREGHDLGWC